MASFQTKNLIVISADDPAPDASTSGGGGDGDDDDPRQTRLLRRCDGAFTNLANGANAPGAAEEIAILQRQLRDAADELEELKP